MHRGLWPVSRGGLEPAFVKPGDSAQGLVLLLAIALVAHGLQVGDVVVWLAIARGHDVVDCPVTAVEVFATCSADRFEHGLCICSGFAPFGRVMPIRHGVCLGWS